ncbi:MAG: TolC family outer membrane protein [Actinomycetota bacterium]
MKRTTRLLAGTILAATLVEPAAAETLQDVLASAYATNPTLLARRARLRATDEGVPQALSGWRPTVTLSGDAGRGTYASSTSDFPSKADRTPRDVEGTLTQPIFSGGRTIAGVAQAENTVLAERALLDATEQQVLLNAASAYLNVVRDEAVLKLSINNEQVLRRQLEAAQERFRVGEITRTDVSQAEARLSRATADRVGAEGTLQDSRANYLNVVGRPPENLQAPANVTAVPASLDEVTARTLSNNPNVVAADYTYKAADDGVDVVRADLLPQLNLTLDDTRTWHALSSGSTVESTSAMVKLTVPIYEGGATYARLRAQKHTAGQRRIEADQARRDAVETATRAFEDLNAARARVRSFVSQIKASELALAGVEEEARVGSRTVLDVLNAEQELFDARVNLARAQRDEAVAAFQLRSALGEMTAKALSLPVDVYDPVKHYEDVRGQWIGTGIDKEKGYE